MEVIYLLWYKHMKYTNQVNSYYNIQVTYQYSTLILESNIYHIMHACINNTMLVFCTLLYC